MYAFNYNFCVGIRLTFIRWLSRLFTISLCIFDFWMEPWLKLLFIWIENCILLGFGGSRRWRILPMNDTSDRCQMIINFHWQFFNIYLSTCHTGNGVKLDKIQFRSFYLIKIWNFLNFSFSLCLINWKLCIQSIIFHIFLITFFNAKPFLFLKIFKLKSPFQILSHTWLN